MCKVSRRTFGGYDSAGGEWRISHFLIDFCVGLTTALIFHSNRQILANVNSLSRSLYVIARPSVVCLSSVVCNVRAPYSGD